MSEEFVILHLSDTHIGKSGDGVDENVVLKPLLDDIANIHNAEKLTPNLIVFSGDMVQGCLLLCDAKNCVNGGVNPECKLGKQYKDAEQFIKSVVEKAGAKLGQIPLLIVPGNHDVNRHLVTINQQAARDKYDVNLVDQIQKDSLSWNELIKRQNRWFGFAKSLPNHKCVIWDDKFYVPYGTIEACGKKIGFIGLNTSWAAHANKERHKLWIGKNQFDSLCQKLDGTDFKIAVSHHPCSWLHINEFKNKEQKIMSEFNLHFHGHEHSDWFLDSTGHLRVEGGAAYENSEKINAYYWLSIDFHNNKGKIYARTFSNKGAVGWVPANAKDKIINGIGKIQSLFISQKDTDKKAEPVQTTKTYAPATNKLPTSTIELITQLEHKFKLRWECITYEENVSNKQVFWPVRLRLPTAIHASQCFVAASLQKTGCSINLFIDNFVHDHSEADFLSKIKLWFCRAGGNYDAVSIHRYKEYEEILKQNKRETLEKLLSDEIIFTDTILKISKIWHSSDNPKSIVSEITHRRPRRLLAPAMTWTCLRKLCEEKAGASIITLGGYDEKILWETWRNCFGLTDLKVGHLYVSELSGLHMADNKFKWSGKEDIENEFKRVMNDRGSLKSHNKMIPWCVNNCVLLPKYITSSEFLSINGKLIEKVEDLSAMNPIQCVDNLVQAVAEWVL